MEVLRNIQKLLGLQKQPGPEYGNYLRRMHRRVEGMLLHPLSHKVINPVNRDLFVQTRDALRASLNLSEDLAIAIGQQAVDDEVKVVLADDGFYVFRLRHDYENEEATFKNEQR